MSNSWPDLTQIETLIRAKTPIEFPPIVPGEPPEDRAKRTIDAAVLVSLVGHPCGSVDLPIVISNAVITGDLTLAFTKFQCDLRLTGCEFLGAFDVSFAKFSTAAAFNGSTFQKVVFRGAEAAGDLDLTGATFQQLDASHLTVGRDLLAQASSYTSDAVLSAIHVTGTANFQGAQFHGDVNFDLAQIEGGLEFGGDEYPLPTGTSQNSFEKAASFISCSAKAYASFIGAKFLDSVTFDGMTIQGDARFDGVQFAPARTFGPTEYISFYGCHIVGQAIFDAATVGAYIRFDQARFDADASFCSVTFQQRARFDHATFGGPVNFGRRETTDQPATFAGDADFVSTAAPEISFYATVFQGNLSFRDANFKSVSFQDAKNPNEVCTFPPHRKPWWHPGRLMDRKRYPQIDLRGFTYDRVQIDDRAFGTLAFIEPFDVQAYRQAEKVLRGMGRGRAADQAYLVQRWRTTRYHLARPTHWLRGFFDLLYGLVIRFGVRPYRLIGAGILLLAFSTVQFVQPNAATPKKDSGCVAHTLTTGEAFGMSVSYLLPVEVPVSSCWQATKDEAFEVFDQPVSFLLWATIVRLAGWIIVPVGAAAVTGLLRRDPPK